MSNADNLEDSTPEDIILKAIERPKKPLQPGQLTPEQFVLKAIEKLRTPPYKGIHSVYSGFNAAFREYFRILDPVDITKKLAEEGKIVIRPTRGGVMLYKAGDVQRVVSAKDALKKILENTDRNPQSESKQELGVDQ